MIGCLSTFHFALGLFFHCSAADGIWGCRFYYADERVSSGAPVFKDISGPAAAEEYVRLAEQKEQGPWLDTFVKGEGYKDFEAGAKL